MIDDKKKRIKNDAKTKTEAPSVWESLAVLADRLIQRAGKYYLKDYPYSIKDASSWVHQAIEILENLLQEGKKLMAVGETIELEEWEKRLLTIQTILPAAWGLCGDICRAQKHVEEAVTWYRKAREGWRAEKIGIETRADHMVFLYVKYIDCLRRTSAAKSKEVQQEEMMLIAEARCLKEELRKYLGTYQCLKYFYDWEDTFFATGEDWERLQEILGQLYGIYLWKSDSPEEGRIYSEAYKRRNREKEQDLSSFMIDELRESKYLRALNPWKLSGGSGEERRFRPLGWLEWNDEEYVAAIPWKKKWMDQAGTNQVTFWKICDSDQEEYALRAEKVTDETLLVALKRQYRGWYQDGLLAEPVMTRQLIDFRKWDPLVEKKKSVLRSVARVMFFELASEPMCDLDTAGYSGFEQGAYTRTMYFGF